MKAWTLCRKSLISVFVSVNLITVMFMNRPSWMITSMNQWYTSRSRMTAWRFSMGEWYLRRYAHLAGLDNQWQMFGRQSRFNWWFEIKAVYAGSKTVLLPLPLQSPRTFWQHNFLDFKEGKFHLNLYPSVQLREAYAHYLCREYPTAEGAPIESIIFELHHQMLILPPDSATRHSFIEPQSYSRLLNQFPCPAPAP